MEIFIKEAQNQTTGKPPHIIGLFFWKKKKKKKKNSTWITTAIASKSTSIITVTTLARIHHLYTLKDSADGKAFGLSLTSFPARG